MEDATIAKLPELVEANDVALSCDDQIPETHILATGPVLSIEKDWSQYDFVSQIAQRARKMQRLFFVFGQQLILVFWSQFLLKFFRRSDFVRQTQIIKSLPGEELGASEQH